MLLIADLIRIMSPFSRVHSRLSASECIVYYYAPVNSRILGLFVHSPTLNLIYYSVSFSLTLKTLFNSLLSKKREKKNTFFLLQSFASNLSMKYESSCSINAIKNARIALLFSASAPTTYYY